MAAKKLQIKNYWRNLVFWVSILSGLIFVVIVGIHAFISQQHNFSEKELKTKNEYNFVMVCTGVEKISNNLSNKEESTKSNKTIFVNDGSINHRGCLWNPQRVICTMCSKTEFVEPGEFSASPVPEKIAGAENCEKEILKSTGIIRSDISLDRFSGSIRTSEWKRVNGALLITEFVGTCEKVKQKLF